MPHPADAGVEVPQLSAFSPLFSLSLSESQSVTTHQLGQVKGTVCDTVLTRVVES